MKVAQARAPYPLLLLGAVRGSEAEGDKVLGALDAYAPGEVDLGLSPEEVRALGEHFLTGGSEPWVPLAASEAGYARGLARFGPVRVPSPAFVTTLRWAHDHGVEPRGVEPSDEHYGELFYQHLGFFDLVLRTRAERSLARAPPEHDTPEGYAEAWEARAQTGRGSRRLVEARARHVVERLRDLHRSPTGSGGASASLKNRRALVVDVERFAPLREELRRAGWKDLRDTAGPDAAPDAPLPSGPPLRSEPRP